MDPIKTITSLELERLLQKDRSISIVDVREDDEIAAGKIPQAKHIRLNEIPARKEELAKDQTHFIICHSGVRSGKACEYLQALGYDVVNVVDGMLDWEGEVE